MRLEGRPDLLEGLEHPDLALRRHRPQDARDECSVPGVGQDLRRIAAEYVVGFPVHSAEPRMLEAGVRYPAAIQNGDARARAVTRLPRHAGVRPVRRDLLGFSGRAGAARAYVEDVIRRDDALAERGVDLHACVVDAQAFWQLEQRDPAYVVLVRDLGAAVEDLAHPRHVSIPGQQEASPVEVVDGAAFCPVGRPCVGALEPVCDVANAVQEQLYLRMQAALSVIVRVAGSHFFRLVFACDGR